MTDEELQNELRQRKQHHATAARDAWRQQSQQQNPDEVEPAQAPQAPAAAEPQPIPAPTAPEPVPASTTPAQSAQDDNTVTVADVFSWGFEPGDTSVPDATVAPTDPIKTERERQLEARIAELENQTTQLTAAQEQELEQRRAEQEELETLRAYKRQQETERLLDMGGIEFDNLDPEAARELSQKYLKPVLERQQKAFEERTAAMARRIDELDAKRQAEEQQLSEQQKTEKLARVNGAILAAHPDYMDIHNSSEYQKILAQRVKGSRTRLADIAASEYHAGNPQFIIDLVSQYKAGRPSLEDIASATTSGTGSVPASDPAEPEYSNEDVTKWNAAVATGELSRDDYRKLMAKYREQRSRQSD